MNLDGFALPVKKLKGTDPVETLDLSGKGENLGAASLVVIASLISVNGALTECNVSGNLLDIESAKKLAKIGIEKGIMLFGIERDQEEANFVNLFAGYFQGPRLRPADAILISSDLVIGTLTEVLAF